MLTKNLNKIVRYPEKIPCDKRLHMLIGVVYVIMGTLFKIPIIYLAGGLPVVAWGIEYFQKRTKSGTYDNWDATAVIIGGLMVLIPYFIEG